MYLISTAGGFQRGKSVGMAGFPPPFSTSLRIKRLTLWATYCILWPIYELSEREIDFKNESSPNGSKKGVTMRKADIANEVFEKLGISKKESADILEVILNSIKEVLKKGEMVKIAGFGNFVVRQKRARKGRNPKTGEEIGITPRRVVTFRPSQVFKKFVNQ
jgi:integration host factor subunit alpha